MSRPKGMIAATPIAIRDRKRVVRSVIPTKSVKTQWRIMKDDREAETKD